MSSRFTDRTIRAGSYWVKITRDNQKRDYTFAIGHVGQFKAFTRSSYSFTRMANWAEAEDWAKYMTTSYE